MKKYIIFLVFAVGFIASISSCKDNNNLDELQAEELLIIDDYINNSDLNYEKKSSGIYVAKTYDAGNDSAIDVRDEVQVFFTERLINSSDVLYSTADTTVWIHYSPWTLVVGTGQPNLGFDEGLTYLKAGDKAKILVPSELAYKATNNTSIFGKTIPRFSTIIYDVEIYKHTLSQDLQ